MVCDQIITMQHVRWEAIVGCPGSFGMLANETSQVGFLRSLVIGVDTCLQLPLM